MEEYKLLLPSMGEGVMEAKIITWLCNEGDTVNEDDSVVEIATDKVDSEVPTPVSGKIIKILKKKDEVAKVGETIAIMEIFSEENSNITSKKSSFPIVHEEILTIEHKVEEQLMKTIAKQSTPPLFHSDLYLSPLVKSIIEQENISKDELSTIKGSGLGGRITKEDILVYLSQRESKSVLPTVTTSVSNSEEVIPMDRVRKIIAENMVKAKQIAPHVTSFIETDVTNVVKWRNKNKFNFEKREGEKLTFMPIFVKAIVKAIQDFPLINISVEDNKIIKKKNINIGMATALPNGNLIVPVIKNADQLSILGLAKTINNLAYRARNKKLKPEDTHGATYTVSNIGSFGNLMGTPIIPQPQVAILAVGAIIKKPAVLETPDGDVIGIRNLMFMSHSYDHRVVDGSLGGMFLKHVHDYLQNWDINTEI